MTNYLFDSSAIIPVFFKSHPHHNYCIPWFEKVISSKTKGYISTHALAEVYANITIMPIQPKINPNQAHKLLTQYLIKKFTVIDLSTKNYRDALAHSSRINGRSGIIYDALHFQAAKKKEIKNIISINERHFARLVDDSNIKIINPLTTKP